MSDSEEITRNSLNYLNYLNYPNRLRGPACRCYILKTKIIVLDTKSCQRALLDMKCVLSVQSLHTGQILLEIT